MSRPNVVFLFTDDQRFDTIGALGNDVIRTPNIDRLVARGSAFTHAHIPCGTSGAVCMPSRAMLHTGRSLFRIEGAGESIPEAHATLGEAFRQAGYNTFGAGKWHNGVASYARSFSHGDEIFFGGMADHWNVPACRYDPRGKYDKVCLAVNAPASSNEVSERRCDHIHAGVHSTDIIADAGARFLQSSDAAEPFFMYLSFLAPHDPRTMPGHYRQMYDPAEIPTPPNFLGGHPFENGALRIRDELLAAFPRDPDEVRRHIAEYYAMITHLDDAIGRVVEAVEKAGKLAETIFVFAGDNGLAVGQHGLMGKQSCYEHSVRVPLVLAGPGVPAGERSVARAYLFDIFPTLCELCGVETPATVEGTSLAPALNDPAETLREAMYFAYCQTQRAVKRDGFKLIDVRMNGRRTGWQLFDLENDPWETNNLIDDPAYKNRREALTATMAELRDEWGDCQTEWGRAFWASRR